MHLTLHSVTQAVQCSVEVASTVTADTSSHGIANDRSHGIKDSFTPEEEARFIIRYNENYDLLDPRYLAQPS